MPAVAPATALAPGTGRAAIPVHTAYANVKVPHPILIVVSLVTSPEIGPHENDTPSRTLISDPNVAYGVICVLEPIRHPPASSSHNSIEYHCK